MLSLENVRIQYDGVIGADQITLNVMAGETVMLIGANGAGKSSILGGIIGTAPLSCGSIRFKGEDLANLACHKRIQKGIGYSPEGRRVFEKLSVEDNLRVGAGVLPLNKRKKAVDKVMESFPLLKERRNQRTGQLSGGERQVVAIARAVVGGADLLLLDEPFLGLAPIWIDRVSDVIRTVVASGSTVLMAEQMARPALEVAERAYVIRSGRITASGPVSELKDQVLVEQYL